MAIDWAALGSAAKSAAASSAKSAAAQMGSAAVATGGGLLSQIFFGAKNWKRTKELNKQTFEYNKDLAEQAFRQNVQMWNAENAYNTPAAQMMRMRAAGLNPNLLYGNGQEASAGLAGDAPNLQYGDYNPKVSYFDTNGGFQAINAAMSLSQLNSLLDLQRSQSNLNDMNAIKASEEGKYVGVLAKTKVDQQVAQAFKDNMLGGQVELNNEQIRQNIRHTGLQSDILDTQLKYMDRTLDLANQLSAAQLQDLQQQYKNHQREYDEIGQNIRTAIQLEHKLFQEGKLTEQDVLNAKEELNGIKAKNRSLAAQAGIDEKELEFVEAFGAYRYLKLGVGLIDKIL